MSLTGRSRIAGSEVDCPGGTFHAWDPTAGRELEPAAQEADTELVAAAAEAAAGAAEHYRSLPRETRAAFLDAIAEEIEAIGDTLLQQVVIETGLPLARATGERGRTCGQLRLFAQVVRAGDFLGVRVDPAIPDRQPLPRPDLRQRRIPLGPVAVFGASNFPLAFSVAGGDTASALAAGCPVVVKGHPAHPGTSELVADAITRAAHRTGVPAGVFSLVQSSVPDVAQALVQHPAIQAVGFTGSRAGGLALVDVAARRERPIPVYAEMSAVNPVVVLPGALTDPEGLAAGYVASLVKEAGQYCTNPGLLLVPSGEDGDRLVAAVRDELTQQPAQVMLTAGIADRYREGTGQRQAADGVREVGAGEQPPAEGSARSTAHEVEIASLSGRPELLDEVFGPAGLIVRYDDMAEAVRLLEGIEGQLTATMHGTDADLEDARRLLPVLERRAGRVLWGGWPTGVEVAPAMVHGGPFPATSDGRSTSVGTLAIDRWLRPVCYQSFPAELLPDDVRDESGLPRLQDGQRQG
ncbi:aldehyde dehydrogenase (NADP(+)) [Actinomycetota bacterium]